MKKLLLVLLLSTGLYASQEENSDAQQELNSLDLDFSTVDMYYLMNEAAIPSKGQKHPMNDDDDITQKRFCSDQLLQDLRSMNSIGQSSLSLPDSNTYNDDFVYYMNPDSTEEIENLFGNENNTTGTETTSSFQTTSLPILDSAIENSEKYFKCPYKGCNQSFSKKNSLTRHKKKHTGTERSHICPHNGCNKSFFLKHHLKEHIKTHTGEKNHICPHEGCNQSFYQFNNLKEHIQTHTGEKHNICRYCNKPFIQKGTLSRHIKSQHKDLPSNKPKESADSKHSQHEENPS